MKKYINDVFLILGFLFIISTTFSLNVYVGFYLLGITFVFLGLLLYRMPDEHKKNG
ncbi:hypothetical protein LHV56_19230 [Peribacillus frigoritolerans]|uniref:hypothetical protein n=1 Tax=Peribacillus frigoritolerans TaxID=450367 RepID=UPI00207A0BEC|nr:hypothetical protein [Peribacillus frigoritolerans]USK78965.1 hypothetical protein LHV56_19230 [Peribacillus frigoritolerans]